MSGYDITSVADRYLTREPYRKTEYPKTLAIHTALYVILTSLKK